MAIKVLVFAEIRDGENLTKSTREALGLGRRLVENSSGGEVGVVLAVQSAGSLPQSVAAWGADVVLVAESAEFGNYCRYRQRHDPRQGPYTPVERPPGSSRSHGLYRCRSAG